MIRFPAKSTRMSGTTESRFEPKGTASKETTSYAQPETRSTSRRRIICASGDDLWFQQIKRDLFCLQPEWQCERFEQAPEVQTALSSGSCDALVVDVRIAGGPQLLDFAEKTRPRALRAVLCDLKDKQELSKWSRPGLTPLPQTCDAFYLSESLCRTWRLQAWMADPSLRRILSLIRKLPVLPKLHTQVTNELRSPNGSLEEVGRIISQDPVMVAKMLQVVNSAFFALAYEITSPVEAVMFLGTERTRSLVLFAQVFWQFDAIKCPGFSPELIWSHSLQVGAFARTIALGETKDSRIGEAAFTAGLLHDVGKLVLAGNLPDMYNAVQQLRTARRVSQRDAEIEVMGTTHAELGACLLGTWGLPLPILEAIAWHHCPQQSEDENFSLLTAVHAANVLAVEAGYGSGGGSVADCIDPGYLSKIGLDNRRNVWRTYCGLETKPAEELTGDRVRRRQEAKQN
jgi:HD-like signal output (HDOD) protein